MRFEKLSFYIFGLAIIIVMLGSLFDDGHGYIFISSVFFGLFVAIISVAWLISSMFVKIAIKNSADGLKLTIILLGSYFIFKLIIFIFKNYSNTAIF